MEPHPLGAPQALPEGTYPGWATVPTALGRAWSGEALPGIASHPHLLDADRSQNVHFWRCSLYVPAAGKEGAWAGGEGCTPQPGRHPSPPGPQLSLVENQEFPGLSKPLGSQAWL